MKEWIFNHFFQNIEKMYLRQCPYGKEKLHRLTLEAFWKTAVVSVISVTAILVFNICIEKTVTLYCFCSLLFAVYLCSAEIPERLVYQTEERIYYGMLRYFASVKHDYLACHNIPNAIHDAAEEASEELRLHAGVFYEILTGGDRKEQVRRYVLSSEYNYYFKLFFIQAYEASEKGDMETLYSSSLFSENVEYLRTEIMQEIYRRKRRAYELSGYAFVAVAPFFAMSVLKSWGLGFTSELAGFYAGAGNSIMLLCLAASFAAYSAINRAKELTMKRKRSSSYAERIADYKKVRKLFSKLEKHTNFNRLRRLLVQAGDYSSPRALLLKMAGSAGVVCLVITVFFAVLHDKEREQLLYGEVAIEQLVPVASAKQKEAVSEHILTLTGMYKKQEVSYEQLLAEFRERMYFANKEAERAAVTEVLRRIQAYQNSGVRWYEFLLLFCSMAVAAVLPVLELCYRKRLLLSNALLEVKQFQSVVWLERRLEDLTIPALLEDMEVFASVFRPVLRECINSYSAGPERALLQMKAAGRILHEGFADLADGFLAVEEVGIEEAFAEVENNRNMLDKMSQLEAEIEMERKKDNTDMLSKVPGFLVVGVYFILPFLWVSLSGVAEVFQLLEEFQY